MVLETALRGSSISASVCTNVRLETLMARNFFKLIRRCYARVSFIC